MDGRHSGAEGSIGRPSLPRRPLAQPWRTSPTVSLGIGLYGRLINSACLPARGSRTLILVGENHIGRHGQHTEGRGFLLGRHHLLANARHRVWRLDRSASRPLLTSRAFLQQKADLAPLYSHARREPAKYKVKWDWKDAQVEEIVAPDKFTADPSPSDCGHACHVAVKAKDYIFHPYQKR